MAADSAGMRFVTVYYSGLQFDGPFRTGQVIGPASGSTRDITGCSTPSISTYYPTCGRPVARGTVLIVPGLSIRAVRNYE